MFAEDDLTIQHLDISGQWKWSSGIFRFCFFFPKQGRGVYQDGKTTRAFSAGDILVLNTRVRGSIQPEGGGKLKAVFFHAFAEHQLAVFAMSEFCLLEKSARGFGEPWYYPCRSPLALKCHSLVENAPTGHNGDHRAHVQQIVTAIVSRECRLAPREEGHEDFLFSAHAPVLNQLSLEQIQHSSIEALAKKHGYSRRHLNRLFHQRFGVSISALKMEMRLLKAVDLLRDPESKVLGVAMDCGFNQLSLFSARFKKRFGVSPNQWREKLAMSADEFSRRRDGDLCPVQSKGLCPMPARDLKCPCAQAGGAAFLRTATASGV
jgi:AraC-like DNA-binding protein